MISNPTFFKFCLVCGFGFQALPSFWLFLCLVSAPLVSCFFLCGVWPPWFLVFVFCPSLVSGVCSRGLWFLATWCLVSGFWPRLVSGFVAGVCPRGFWFLVFGFWLLWFLIYVVCCFWPRLVLGLYKTN